MSTAATKSLHLRVKSAGVPSDAQLSLIRRYTLAEIAVEDLYVRTFAIAHNAVDRDSEVIDDALLADFARTLPGKGLFVRHPLGFDGDSGPGEGRWFDARVERMTLDAARELLREPTLTLPPGRTDVTLLYGDAYIARTDDNAALLKKIDAGVAGDVSIGFNFRDTERVLDDEGRELNIYRYLGPGEALEASLVWLGAQPGARAVKHAPRNSENMKMPPVTKTAQEQLDSVSADLATAQSALDAATKTIADLRAALGDDAPLVDEPAEMAALVRAGKSYRADLVDAIIAGERHRGTVGDSADDVAAAKSAYAALPTAKLKTLAGTLGKTTGRPAVTGGDPNGTAPGTKSLAADHPLNNPLIAATAATA